MTDTYNGALHWAGFKPESVPGTAEATVSTFLATEMANAQPDTQFIERKAQMASGRRMAPRVGAIKPNGKCKAELHASQPHPFLWALGAVETTQPAVSTDPTVYLHTITDNVDDGPISLTHESDLVYGKTRQAGCFINKLAMSLEAGEIARIDLDWLGISHDGAPTITSTPAFTTDVLTTMQMLVKIDGEQDFRVPNLDWEWDNLLDAPAVLADEGGAPHFIRRKEPPKCTGKMKFVDFPADQLAILRAAGTFALIIELQGAIISNAYRKFLRITLPDCRYTGGLDPDVTNETITGDADFEAFYDPTVGVATQIIVEAQNTISAINT